MDRGEFLDLFFQESAERLAEFEAALLRLEHAPDDAEIVDLVFRCAHSLKGGSSMMGFTEIAHFTHALEAILDHLREGRLRITPAIMETLLASADVLGVLLSRARSDAPPSSAERDEAAPVLAAIASFVGQAVSGSTAAQARAGSDTTDGRAQQYQIDFRAPADLFRRGLDPLDLIDTLTEVGDLVAATVDLSSLPSLAELEPERCYLAWNLRFVTTRPLADIEDCFDFIAEPGAAKIRAVPMEREPGVGSPAGVDAPISAPVPPLASAPQWRSADREEATVVRVPVHKVDQLVDMVGELATTHALLAEVVVGLSPERVTSLQETVSHIDRQVRQLHEAIMAVRMVSVRTLFARFPRLVRDLATTTGKLVRIETAGEDTELDKTMIELIADPLTHLVRNAIDHGLERCEQRRAAGKPDVGKVQLAAYHQGGHVYIEVSDDGVGLDRDRIVAKAVERGLLAPGESVTDEDAVALIMRPGFSTAQAVTQVSGRGVGMDVVKRNVEALGGTLAVRSERGHGTNFRIQLPLTLAMLDGQVVQVGLQAMVLPIVAITESVRPASGSVHALPNRGEIIVVRGTTLPVIRLHRLFAIEPASEDPTRGIAVIVEHEQRRAALLVDGLSGQQQVVVKSLDTGFGKLEGMAAATILGDGRVALILDVPGLMRLASSGRRRQPPKVA